MGAMRRVQRAGFPGVVAALATGVLGGLALLLAEFLWHQTSADGGAALSLLYIAAWTLLAWSAIIFVVTVAHVVRSR